MKITSLLQVLGRAFVLFFVFMLLISILATITTPTLQEGTSGYAVGYASGKFVRQWWHITLVASLICSYLWHNIREKRRNSDLYKTP
jgi:hypothetical protein